MIIETKYSIGDKVWIVYEQNIYNDNYKGPAGEISVFSSVIVGIIYDKEDGVLYEIEAEGTDWIKENDIIFYGDDVALLNKIKELNKIIEERENKE